MWRDFERIAAALGLPAVALLGYISAATAVLCVAVLSGSDAVAVLSAVSGVGIIAIGLRAVLRPSRPFDAAGLNSPGPAFVNTTRKLGCFYVLAGFVWILVSAAAARV